MVELGFGAYALISTALLGFVCNNAFATRQQFYPAVILLTTSKLHVAVLGNMALLLVLSFGRTVKRIFLGTLTRHEVEELWNNSKHAIVDTAMALTLFHADLSLKVLVLFVSLLFVKIFHWLTALRVENVSRAAHMSVLTHIRLVSLITLLGIVDLAFAGAMAFLFMSPDVSHPHHHQHHTPYDGRGVYILFVFEFTILMVTNIGTLAKYALTLNDARLDGRWHNKSVWMFYLEFTVELIRLFLYLIFGLVVGMQVSFPLHLFREIYMTFHSLRQRIVRFINYRRLTKNMNEWLPDATADELARGDRTCIVCREEMDTAKKLPCNHKFHFHCLRTWLEADHRCPTCRAALPTAPPVATAGIAAAAAAGAGADAPPAAAAALAALPALPPHLQAIQDALRAARETQEKTDTSNTTSANTAPLPSLSSTSTATPSTSSTPTADEQMALLLAHQQREMMATWLAQQQPPSTSSSSGASTIPATTTPAPMAMDMGMGVDSHLLLAAHVATTSSIAPTLVDALSPAISLSLCRQQLGLMAHHITLLEAQLTAVRASYQQQLAVQQLLLNHITSTPPPTTATATAGATNDAASAAVPSAVINEDSKEAVVTA